MVSFTGLETWEYDNNYYITEKCHYRKHKERQNEENSCGSSNIKITFRVGTGSSAMNVSIYLENIRVIYFSLPTTIKHGWQKITLHWISSIIRNNKCIFLWNNFNNLNVNNMQTKPWCGPWRRKFSRLNDLFIVMFITLWYSRGT
jgi:hypothetical protein